MRCQTLPDAEWTNGLVEMAKAALLQGGEALDRFEGALTSLLWREPAAVAGAVWDAVAFKARVVTPIFARAGCASASIWATRSVTRSSC